MADITALGDGKYRVTDGSAQWLLYAAKSAEATWVFFDGRVYVVDAVRLKADPTYAASYVGSGFSRTNRPTDGMALASPMPATVVSILVVPGQDVRQDDLLVMLEAMKMELPIKAPRDGRIKTIACNPGELVQAGVPLIELEHEPRSEKREA